jgi:adenine/guanine/hypoxanthine permease
VTDDAYNACVAEVHRELITTTAAVSCLASVLMGVLANLPVGLAPGLGLNAYVSPLHISFLLRCERTKR